MLGPLVPEHLLVELLKHAEKNPWSSSLRLFLPDARPHREAAGSEKALPPHGSKGMILAGALRPKESL